MATKRELLGSELMKEIIRIRIDTLWYMLALKAHGRLPPVDAEKATGDFDDKGALFVPGGFVFYDWEEKAVRKRPYSGTAEGFRKTVRNAMQYDGAHLLYEDGIATRVKLGNTAFHWDSGTDAACCLRRPSPRNSASLALGIWPAEEIRNSRSSVPRDRPG